jgi:hypothetical protein
MTHNKYPEIYGIRECIVVVVRLYQLEIEPQELGQILLFEARIDEQHLDAQVQLELIEEAHDEANEPLELVGDDG